MTTKLFYIINSNLVNILSFHHKDHCIIDFLFCQLEFDKVFFNNKLNQP